MTQQEKAMSDVKRKIDNAIKLVSDLCKPRGSAGAREWIMSIPARPDYDPDIVISDALYSASTEITRLTKQLAESQRQNAELRVGLEHISNMRAPVFGSSVTAFDNAKRCARDALDKALADDKAGSRA